MDLIFLPSELTIFIGLNCDYKSMLILNQVNKYVYYNINFVIMSGSEENFRQIIPRGGRGLFGKVRY